MHLWVHKHTQQPVSSENTISLSCAHIWLQSLAEDQDSVTGQGILNRFAISWDLFSFIFFNSARNEWKSTWNCLEG